MIEMGLLSSLSQLLRTTAKYFCSNYSWAKIKILYSGFTEKQAVLWKCFHCLVLEYLHASHCYKNSAAAEES